MTSNLRAVLPILLPKAIVWAEACSAEIVKSGAPLDQKGLSLAQRVGAHPDRIRVLLVSQLPLPADPELRQAGLETGLFSPNIVGLTFGYGIYVRHGHDTTRLLSHEFRHVQQYQQAGSIAAFLPIYLQQIVDFGYASAPLEIDARNHEVHS